LTNFGLGDLMPKEVPGGWKVIVEPVGLAADSEVSKNKLGAEPMVCTFVVPPLWIVNTPNIDFNGAAGTLQANDYNKGDSATLYVDTKFTGNLNELTKNLAQAEVKKALTMKGKGFIEALKVRKVRDGSPGYKIIEYDYEIESGAGFTINRNGIAAFTQVGKAGNLQILWCGTLTSRYGQMKDSMNNIINSFRISPPPDYIKIETKSYVREDELLAREIGV